MGKTGQDEKKKEAPKFYKIAVNIYDGAGMINLFGIMGGSDQEKILRKEVTQQFLDVFPESDKPAEEKPPKSVRRILKLSKRHVRAIAHSAIAIYGKDDTKGAGADRIQELSKAWGIWGYMRDTIGPESYPEFEGELDDQPDFVDEEAVAEAAAIEKAEADKVAGAAQVPTTPAEDAT